MKDPILRCPNSFRLTFLIALLSSSFLLPYSQPLTKIRIGYSGTGDSQYILQLPRTQGIFQKNGLAPKIVSLNTKAIESVKRIGVRFQLPRKAVRIIVFPSCEVSTHWPHPTG
jgi:hypothetical protein